MMKVALFLLGRDSVEARDVATKDITPPFGRKVGKIPFDGLTGLGPSRAVMWQYLGPAPRLATTSTPRVAGAGFGRRRVI